MRLKKHHLVLGVALILSCSLVQAADPAAPAAAKPTAEAATDAVVATVNGVAIPKALFDYYVQQLTTRSGEAAVDADELIDDLIQQELLIQEAQKKNLLKPEELEIQLETMRRNLLARAAVQHILSTLQPTEEAMKKEYDAMIAGMHAQEYQVRHILVDSEEAARQVIEKLNKGEKFEDLAKARSTDPSKEQGGELGWVSASDVPSAIGDAMTKLEKDQFSQVPIQTEHGWHVLKVDDLRAATPPSFDELQPTLMEKVQEANIQSYLKGLREKATIKIITPAS